MALSSLDRHSMFVAKTCFGLQQHSVFAINLLFFMRLMEVRHDAREATSESYEGDSSHIFSLWWQMKKARAHFPQCHNIWQPLWRRKFVIYVMNKFCLFATLIQTCSISAGKIIKEKWWNGSFLCSQYFQVFFAQEAFVTRNILAVGTASDYKESLHRRPIYQNSNKNRFYTVWNKRRGEHAENIFEGKIQAENCTPKSVT
jgi:hypothetical protein